jgi:hypothetical protein
LGYKNKARTYRKKQAFPIIRFCCVTFSDSRTSQERDLLRVAETTVDLQDSGRKKGSLKKLARKLE